jgi:hypothetical protein
LFWLGSRSYTLRIKRSGPFRIISNLAKPKRAIISFSSASENIR